MSDVLSLHCQHLSDDLSGLALRRLPRAALAPGEVRIRVHAAGLNFPDLLMTRGLYQHKPSLPFVPGMEGAGVVIECGAAVANVQSGQAVSFGARSGALAEEVVVPASSCRAMPAGLSFDEGACYAVTGLTAWVALQRCGRLQRGESLLVNGARGGVGWACLQLGQHLGARVVATASQPERLGFWTDQGVSVLAAGDATLADQVKALTLGQGVDVVADPVGGNLFDRSLRCLAWGGRLLVLGFAEGRLPTLAVNYALIKGLSIIGVRAGEYGRRYPERAPENLAAVDHLAAAGVLRPRIGARFALGDAAQAMAAMASGAVVGKIVVVVAR